MGGYDETGVGRGNDGFGFFLLSLCEEMPWNFYKILELLKKINQEKGTSILFISHNLNVVRKLCGRVAVMHKGHIVETGTAEGVFHNPQDPYTQRLIAAIPTRDKRLR